MLVPQRKKGAKFDKSFAFLLFGRKQFGSEPPNYFNLEFFVEILKFVAVVFPRTTDGVFRRSDKIIVRLAFRMSQHKRWPALEGQRREHENGKNCVLLNDMWDAGSSPTKSGGPNHPIISIWTFVLKSLCFLPWYSLKRRLVSSLLATKLLCD